MPRAVRRNRSGLEKTLRPAAIEIVLEKLSHSGEAGTAGGRFAALEKLARSCRSRLRGGLG
jgi:hypothetical protein